MSNDLELKLVLKGDGKSLVGTVQLSRKEIKALSGEMARGARSGKKLDKSLDDTSKSAKLAGKAVNRLGAITAGYFTGKAVFGAIKAADQYNILQQRIRTATQATGDYVSVSKELYAISQQNGAALQDSVELFQGLARSAPELNATNDQMLRLTNLVQQLGAISGASDSAMSAGMLQFGQAMAAGVVRAEEMNSLLENVPELANRIAKGLNMTVGELRQAVLKGEVLSKDVFQALIKQAGEIDKEFKSMPPTLERSTQTLSNSFDKFLGSLDQSIGLSQTLAKNFTGLASTLDRMAKTPYLFLPEIKDHTKVSDRDRLTQIGSGTGKGATGASFAMVAQDLARLEEEVARTTQTMQAQLLSWGPDMTKWTDVQRQAFDLLTQSARQQGAAIARLKPEYEGLKRALGAPEETAKAAGPTDKELAQITKIIEGIREKRAQLEMTAAEQVRYQLTTLHATEAQQRQAVVLVESIEHERMLSGELDAVIAQQEAMEQAYDARMQANQGVVEALEEELELMRLGERERAAEIEMRKLSVDATDEQRERVRQLAGEMYEAQNAQRKLTDAGQQGFKELKQAVEGWGKSFARTLASGEQDFKGFARSIVQQMQEILISKATDPLFSAFGDWVSGAVGGGGKGGGGFDFGSIASSIGNFFGGGGGMGGGSASFFSSFFADGGVMTSAGPLPLHYYAEGGIVNRPQVRVAGERYTPEAIVPLPNGRAIPVQMQGGGGGGVVYSPTFNINATSGGDKAELRKIARDVSDEGLAKFKREIGRGGSAARLVGRRR